MGNTHLMSISLDYLPEKRSFSYELSRYHYRAKLAYLKKKILPNSTDKSYNPGFIKDNCCSYTQESNDVITGYRAHY